MLATQLQQLPAINRTRHTTARLVGRQRVKRTSCIASPSSSAGVQPMDVDVAVVGAGPAGLAAAAALHIAKPSLRIHVFEKTSMTARGAAVLVGVNGLKALEAIGGEILERLLAGATKLDGSDRYNMYTGEYIESMQMRNDEFKEKYGYHNALLGWSDITAALRSALPEGSITHSCPITGYKTADDGTVQLLASSPSTSSDTIPSTSAEPTTADTVVASCKVLIGADGWFSPIRQQLLADGPPTFKKCVVYRARIPKPDWMPQQRTKWWIPPEGPRQGELLAVLIPLPDGDMVWQCHTPLKVMEDKGLSFTVSDEAASSHADSSGSGSTSKASVKERCLKTFEDFPRMFLDVVADTPESAITEHGLYQRTTDQIPDDSWGSGLVTLVGDAAHTAFVDGTGLGLALEDAAVLAWHVQQQGLTEAALRAFEKERIPRVKEVFSLSDKQAAAMASGVPQRQLLDQRAEVLYGKAQFRPLAKEKAATEAAEAQAAAVL